MKTVLFACVHNAGRSQMAAAFFNRLADGSKARAISAGTNPGSRVHPEVVETMREVGVDLAGVSPTRLTPGVAGQGHLLVTMGCGDECPYVPGAMREDWPLDDPKGKPIERVREIRDEIRDRVRALVEREGWAIPVACTLTPEDLRNRREGLLAELMRHATALEELPDGVRLHFPADGDTWNTIARAVDAERQCCRFLRFQITVEPAGGPISLEVTGPPGTREFVAALLAE
jgi:arsenate reductase